MLIEKMNTDYKCVVFDIDGTLRVQGKHYIPDSTVETLRILKKRNIKIALASGRTIQAIDKELLDLRFDYLICVNGAYILNKNMQIIYKNTIDISTSHKLIKYFRCHNYALSLRYVEGSVSVCNIEQLQPFFNLFFHKNSKKTKVIYDIDIMKELPVGGVCRINTSEVNKVKKEFSSLTFFDIVDGEYFDITKSTVSKATAIDYICKIMGIDIKEVIAFGDGDNDKEMLQKVGFGIAMGNANEDVKKVSDYVTDDIENNGIKKAVDKFIL